MKRWWLVIVLLLSLGVNVGLLASRPWRGPGASGERPGESPAVRPADRPPRFALRMADELRLRGERRAAFLERQRLFLDETLAARERFGSLQAELRRQLIAAEPDREAVDELLEQIAAAHVELERAFVGNLLDSRELLGPERERRFLRLLQQLRSSRQRERPLPGERSRWRERLGRDRPER